MTEELNGGCLDERGAFEAWIRKDAGDLSTFGSGGNRHYRNSAVNNAWGGWKMRASLSTSKQAGAEPVEYLRAVGDGTHELVGKHERGAFPVYATPPAVMPAAPSDSALSAIRDLTTFGPHHAGNGMQRGGDYVRLGDVLSALAQTMQPQAEPAAEEQAGAVADKLRAIELFAGHIRRTLDSEDFTAAKVPGLKDGLLYGACERAIFIQNAVKELRAALAAPGAAIAAREQEAALHEVLGYAEHWAAVEEKRGNTLDAQRVRKVIASLASRDEAPATPQGEPQRISPEHDKRNAAGARFAVEDLKLPLPALPEPFIASTEIGYSLHRAPEVLRFGADCYRLALTQPTTVQQAEPSDVQMEQIADAIWGAQKKRLPMSAAIEFARAVLALKTAQTTALPGGDGEGK